VIDPAEEPVPRQSQKAALAEAVPRPAAGLSMQLLSPIVGPLPGQPASVPALPSQTAKSRLRTPEMDQSFERWRMSSERLVALERRVSAGRNTASPSGPELLSELVLLRASTDKLYLAATAVSESAQRARRRDGRRQPRF
jgi:hypothetical protein